MNRSDPELLTAFGNFIQLRYIELGLNRAQLAQDAAITEVQLARYLPKVMGGAIRKDRPKSIPDATFQRLLKAVKATPKDFSSYYHKWLDTESEESPQPSIQGNSQQEPIIRHLCQSWTGYTTQELPIKDREYIFDLMSEEEKLYERKPKNENTKQHENVYRRVNFNGDFYRKRLEKSITIDQEQGILPIEGTVDFSNGARLSLFNVKYLDRFLSYEFRESRNNSLLRGSARLAHSSDGLSFSGKYIASSVTETSVVHGEIYLVVAGNE